MATELWRFQDNGDTESRYSVAVSLSDGNLLVAGFEDGGDTDRDRDFMATKLHPSNRSLIWKWKDGSSSTETIIAAAAGADGSVTLAGYTLGNWGATPQGNYDYAAVKLDSSGTEIWRLQGGSADDDRFRGVAIGRDGYAVLGGFRSEDFFLIKVDDNGDTIWEWSDDSGGEDFGNAVAMPGDDDSVVLGGMTSGNWSGINAGGYENAAVKVDSDGNEVWRWQEGTTGNYGIRSMVATEDNSVIMSGQIYGSTEDDLGSDTPSESMDLVAFKLHTNGTEVWKWQGGTVGDEGAEGSTLADDGSLIICGYTSGNWSELRQGESDKWDPMVATVNASDGGLLSWQWQGVTSEGDLAEDVATGDSSEWVVVVGRTDGSLFADNPEELRKGFMVMFTPDASPIGTSPTPSPSTFRPSTSSTFRPSTSSTFRPSTSSTFRPSTETPTLAPTPGVSSRSPLLPVPTPAPSPHAPWETLAPPSSMDASTPAPFTNVYGPPSTLFPSSAPTPMARSMPSSTSPVQSNSSSPMLMIWVVVPVAGVVALLVLVSCRRQIRVRLRRWYSRNSVNELVEGNGKPGGTSGSVYLRKGSANGGVSGEGDPQAFSGAQEISTVILDSNDVRFPQSGHSSTSFSQGIPAAVVYPSQSVAVPSYLPAYDDVMQWGTTPSGHGGDLPASPSQKASTPSKSETAPCAVDVVRKLRPSTTQGTVGISTRRATTDAERGDSWSAIAGFDATNESKSVSSSGQGVGLGQAILETARELAQASMVPVVSEAATIISVLVKLVTDNKQSDSGADGKLRWCRTIVTLLGRAEYLLGEGQGLSDEVELSLLEDVRDSIDNLVQLIQTYKSKKKLVRLITSTLFKRRQEEVESAVNRTLSYLQVGLQLHGGYKLNAVRQDVEHALLVQQQQLWCQGSVSDDAEQLMAESRRQRRQRQLEQLEQLEIPEEQVTLTNELLGKGGFGLVYMADYNGRNAAVKVLEIELDLEDSEHSGPSHGISQGNSTEQSLRLQSNQRRAFIRELDAMRRLRSPYTVNVYGAVTSRSDRLILVMELMSGGDLRKFLKDASDPIEEERARRIVGEVCAGMTFLHDKQMIHGDLKSANVLFDGYGRAKICDFGTSRWAQHAGCTDLATYTSGANQSTPMSLPWTAPEVLNKGEKSFMSDVYSFGMVTWEVLTREIPWSNESEVLQIYHRVLLKEERPKVPDEAPSDLVDIVRSCWMTEPSRRPSFQRLLRDMKSNGWKEF